MRKMRLPLIRHWFAIRDEWSWLENKITEINIIKKYSWNHLYPLSKWLFDLFWPCPAPFGKQFSEENSWNQLNNWKKTPFLCYIVVPCKADLTVFCDENPLLGTSPKHLIIKSSQEGHRSSSSSRRSGVG